MKTTWAEEIILNDDSLGEGVTISYRVALHHTGAHLMEC